MEIDVELYRTQYDFVACSDRFTAFIAGIGSGKTFGGAVKGVTLAQSGTLGLVAAPTYPMLRDATLRAYQDLLGAHLDVHKGEMLGTLSNGAEILFRSADNPDRLRGPNIHWAHIDEGALCPAGAWDVVIGRLRADGKAGPCFVTSTPKGRNWLYDKADQMRIFRAHTRDNPYLAREFVESLEAAYTGKFAAQELAGEFVGFEGLVYDEFSRERHVIERNGPWRRVIIGADEGYTNPAVLLAIGEDNDGRLHVLDEFYLRRVLQGDVVAACREMCVRHSVEAVVVDPSAAGLIAELKAAGLPARAANNAVTDGIQAVKARLAVAGDGLPRLTFASGCANTIAELESYVWKERAGTMRDEPEKANDHCLVAGTMIKTRRGDVAIENVLVGDFVLTRRGYREVLAGGVTGLSSQVMTAMLSNGASITGTPDHLIWVDGHGYIPLRSLRYGDIMMAWANQRSSSTKGSPSAATQNQRFGPIASTTFLTRHIARLGLVGSIRNFGKTLMATFRMGAKYTMPMAMLSTTQSTISNVLPETTTERITRICYQTGGANGSEATSMRSARKLSAGTNPRRASTGTERSALCPGKVANRMLVYVSTVVRNTKLGHRTATNDSAPTPVGRRTEGPVALMTKSGFASGAKTRSSPTNTRKQEPARVSVVSVSGVLPDRAVVFDLTVDTVHEFFANGVLVHNSMDALRYGVMHLNRRVRRVARSYQG